MPNNLKKSIDAQRALLKDLLRTELSHISDEVYPFMENTDKLNNYLRDAFETLEHCKYLYVMDEHGVQISATVNRFGLDDEALGRDRSTRPYMAHMHQDIDFKLSEAYISRNKKRPSMTAIQIIRDEHSQHVGFLGVDFDLRELPHTDVIYEEPSQWRQIKGDPAIRGGLFAQERVESMMDNNLDNILSVHESLVVDQGVHHFQIHFSSSRSTIWHVDDPYVYRLLTIDELSSPNICLAYPSRPYFDRAIVPASAISKILKQFKALRFADETIYLRSGSLNIVNGKVGLNFSCDGTHYLNYDEFLNKGLDFWFGGESFPQTVAIADEDINKEKLDALIETLAGEGCISVNKLIYRVEKDELPEKLQHLNPSERDYVYKELKSIMNVYDGGVCGI